MNGGKQTIRQQSRMKDILLILFCFAGVVLLVSFTLFRAWKNDAPYIMGEWNRIYYILWFLLSVFLFACRNRREYLKLGFLLIAVLALAVIFGEMNLSHVDECSHLDYICYVAQNHRLPTMNQSINTWRVAQTGAVGGLNYGKRYEAVQVPLYYVLMAIPVSLIRNMRTVLYFCRLVGFALWCVSLLICRKTVRLLCRSGIIGDESAAVYLLCIFGMNPGVLIRCICVSNEPLAILLTVSLLYITFRMLADGFSISRTIAGTAFAVCLFYTKSTGVFVIGGMLLVLLYYRRILAFLASSAAYAASMLPWFFRNIRLYGSPTGMNVHTEIVYDKINPLNTRFNPYVGVFSIFTRKFFIPAEVSSMTTFTDYINTGVSVLVIALLAFCVVRELLRLGRFVIGGWRFSYSAGEKKAYALMTSAALVTANISMLVISTDSTWLNTLIGRYLYFLVIPLVILFTDLVTEYGRKKEIIILVSVFLSCLYLDTYAYYANSIGIQHDLYGRAGDQLEEAAEEMAGHAQGRALGTLTGDGTGMLIRGEALHAGNGGGAYEAENGQAGSGG